MSQSAHINSISTLPSPSTFRGVTLARKQSDVCVMQWHKIFKVWVTKCKQSKQRRPETRESSSAKFVALEKNLRSLRLLRRRRRHSQYWAPSVKHAAEQTRALEHIAWTHRLPSLKMQDETGSTQARVHGATQLAQQRAWHRCFLSRFRICYRNKRAKQNKKSVLANTGNRHFLCNFICAHDRDYGGYSLDATFKGSV